MTPMNPRLSQFGIIGFSAVLMVATGLFAFQSINQLSQSNLLDADSIQTPEGSYSYETRIQKGDAYFEGGFYTEAASEYAYASQLQTQLSEPLLKLSAAYTALNDFTKAEENAKKAYDLEAGSEAPSAETVAIYAHTLLNNSKAEEAINLLNAYSEPNQSLLYTKGLATIATGTPLDAKTYFEQALAQSGTVTPSSIQGFLTAYESYEKAQGSDASYLNALLSKALLDANECVLAENLALSTLKVKSDYRDVWMVLGYSQLQLNELAKAEDSFKAAKKIDSIKPEVHYLLGTTHFLQNEYQEAIDEMELSLLYDFEPAAEAYKKMAESHTALGQYQEALAAYEAMVNVDPSSISLFKEPIRLALEQVQDFDRAETLAQKGITLFPSEALSHSLLAEVYLKKGETDLANDSIQVAFDINPSDAEAHFIAGEIREQQGNVEGAEWEYKKAFELSEAGDDINLSAAESYNRLMTQAVTPAVE